MDEDISISQLRELTSLQATDEVLWSNAMTVTEAYMQQALRYLTRFIEGELTFDEARTAMLEMMP